jgi:hypothetical protein
VCVYTCVKRMGDRTTLIFNSHPSVWPRYTVATRTFFFSLEARVHPDQSAHATSEGLNLLEVL